MPTQDLTERTAKGLPAPPVLSLGKAALFLDLDGTLAPLSARPQDVGPETRRNDLLVRLQAALGGRLAVLSGRTLEDIDRILEGKVVAVAAIHGLVRRGPDGVVHRSEPHPALPGVVARLRAFAAGQPGLIVEDKGLSATLHYRQAPGMAAAVRRLTLAIATETGLTLQHGAMVEELRTPGSTKGDSLCAFLEQQPFAGARPVFLGDDDTDEHGFQAAQGLGGLGVLVGPARPTEACRGLTDVGAALDWLEASL